MTARENVTGVDAGCDVAELIFLRAAATPQAVAVSQDGGEVSYEEFAARAARLAHHLRTLGVCPETLVAVALDRSADQLIAAVAVLAAGGAYVPLDPSYPAQRLSFMLADAGAPVLISRADAEGGIPAAATATVLLDADADLLASYPATPPEQVAGLDHLAYVIYTSGSTGQPKGAMNTRRGLSNRLAWMQETYRLTADDVVLQKTPVGFDVSVWECYWALLAGARTVVAGPDGHRDPSYLAELVAEHKVTVAHFVPSMLQVFLDIADLSQCQSLRQIVVSGEILSAELQRRFFASGLRAELDNLYGPAEAAIDVTRWRCRRDWAELTVPIGGPVANTSTYVLDDHAEPLPDGVEGELCLGGVQVGRGYLRQPALTAERFVPDPFSVTPGARMYRTGDRAQWRPDGALDFHGRLDDQVKIRGVRIELGEIEAVLAGQPGVRGCAAAVAGDGAGARLVVYVVGDASAQELRAGLARTLPSTWSLRSSCRCRRCRCQRTASSTARTFQIRSPRWPARKPRPAGSWSAGYGRAGRPSARPGHDLGIRARRSGERRRALHRSRRELPARGQDPGQDPRQLRCATVLPGSVRGRHSLRAGRAAHRTGRQSPGRAGGAAAARAARAAIGPRAVLEPAAALVP